MTHKIVDVDEDLGERLEELESQNTQSHSDALEDSISDNVPEKYRNKSIEDIIKMHSEAEKVIGRQGTELGTLRRQFDQFVHNQQSNQHESVTEEDSEFDLLEPEKSVDERISKHPSIKRVEELERALAFNEFKDKYPDFRETVSSQEFNDWVAKSPSRLDLYQKADNHDYRAASNLLEQWSEIQEVLSKVAKEEKKMEQVTREKELNEGMTESGTSTATSKKKFRKVDLQRLYREDPDRYAAMQQEIMLAYREGRVI